MASDGCEPDIVTYGTLIARQCKAGRVKVVTKLLRTIQIKDIALNPVIQAQFGQKRSKEAVKLFKELLTKKKLLREMIEKAEALGVVTCKIVFCGLCQGRGASKKLLISF
ncbi:hypothetical protein Peur_011335 [Populus x canadensis]